MISVIIPIYNVEPYLDQCLESVLAQEFEDFEVIGVDDCSPDNSVKSPLYGVDVTLILIKSDDYCTSA